MEKDNVLQKIKDLALTIIEDRERAESYINQLGYKIDLSLEFDKQFQNTIYKLFPVLKYIDCYFVHSYKITLENFNKLFEDDDFVLLVENPELIFVNKLHTNLECLNDKKNEITFTSDSAYLRRYIDYKKDVLNKEIQLIQLGNRKIRIKDETVYKSIKNDFMYSTEYDKKLLSQITDEDIKEFQNTICSYSDIYKKYLDKTEYDKINLFLLRQKLSNDIDKCKIIEKKR